MGEQDKRGAREQGRTAERAVDDAVAEDEEAAAHDPQVARRVSIAGLRREAAAAGKNEADPHGVRVGTAREYGYPIPPDVVDGMILGTEAIRMFVERQTARGLKADGRTFVYWSRKAYIKGISEHLSANIQDEQSGEYRPKTEEELHDEAETTAKAVAVTMPGDLTIHINASDDQHVFRVILHEAMHQRTMHEASQFGAPLGEGIVEFLSEIVLREHGIPFQVHGEYVAPYKFVKHLAKVFGEATMIRCALQDGPEGLKGEFFKYMNDPGPAWDELLEKIREENYDRAREILGEFGGLRAIHAPAEEAAEKAAAAFENDADDMQRDLEEKYSRPTWPEIDGELSARIVMVEGGASHAVLRLNKGGKHGVREGWEMVFGSESKFPAMAAPVLEVKGSSCEVFVTMPKEELDLEPRHPVTLRKGR